MIRRIEAQLMKGTILFLLSSLLILSSGCDWTDGGDSCDSGESGAKDYPSAMDWRRVPLSEVKHPVIIPDSLNLVAYVVRKNVCPYDWYCFAPDSIVLSETINYGGVDLEQSMSVRSFPVPDFQIGAKYVFSFRIVSRPNRSTGYALNGIGYDLLVENNVLSWIDR